MKHFILSILVLMIMDALFAQTQISVGMNGEQVRNAINGNFNTVYNNVDNLQDSSILSLSSIRTLTTEIATINVKKYGAIGNGITDDRSAILNAITAALAVNGTVYFPSGTYYVSSAITFNYSNKSINIIGDGNSTIIGGNDNRYITFDVTVGSAKTFSSNANKKDRSIVLDDASGIATGDILEIRSTDEYCNIGVSSVSKGELCVVQKVSENTVYFDNSLYDDYNHNTTTIKKVNSGKLNIDGLNFKNVAIDIRYIRNSIFSNCTFTFDSYVPVTIADAYDLLVTHFTLKRGQGYTNQNVYGFGVASSQNITVTRSFFSNTGQNMLFGGEHHPTRNILVSYNIIHNTVASNSIDTHTQTEYSIILGNTIYEGGIYAGGSYVDILNNEIINPTSSAITRYREDLTDTTHNLIYTGYENITGNKIYNTIDSIQISGQEGIRIQTSAFEDTVNYLNISNNYVNTSGYALIFGNGSTRASGIKYINVENNFFQTWSRGVTAQQPTIYSNTTAEHNELKIMNNTIINKGTTGLIAAVYLSNSGNFDKVIFENNIVDGKKVYFTSSTDFFIKNNKFYSTQLISYCDNGYARFIGNIFQGSAPQYDADILIGKLTNPPTSVYIKDNFYTIGTYRNVYANGVGVEPTVFRDEAEHYSGNLTDGVPAASEINSIIGASAAYKLIGFRAVIKDTNGTGLTYTYVSDGTDWILQGTPTKAL